MGLSRHGLTLDLLLLVVAHKARDFHRVTDKSVATSVLDSTFDGRVELDNIDSQSNTLCDTSQTVVNGLHLDSV